MSITIKQHPDFTKCLAGIREARQVIAFDVLAHPEPDAVSK